jgi:hypothetical protein
MFFTAHELTCIRPADNGVNTGAAAAAADGPGKRKNRKRAAPLPVFE